MYTYGPVPSRRLGRSLGVSLIPPKTCSYSCVYCQLGRTNRLRVARESFFPREEVLAEIAARMAEEDLDYLSFVGDGEPTLSSDLGWLIRACKREFDRPVAVITNGSLLDRPEVRGELLAADVVLPSLDAGSEAVFRAINRPHGGISFTAMVRGLDQFRREYAGRLWLEVMLVDGLNDTEEALRDIAALVKRVAPDRVYITTPTRPPAEPWVHPPQAQRILRAQELFASDAALTALETGEFGLASFADAGEALLEIGSRHPLRREQALKIERSFSESGVIDLLLESGRLVEVPYRGEVYLLPARMVRKG